MAESYLSEVRMFGFPFAPKGWAQCDGQLLPINQNQALYSLLGTTYGGDGMNTFALPDLRGRAPMSFGDGMSQGEKGGVESVTLTPAEMAAHTHVVSATTDASNVNNFDNATFSAASSAGAAANVYGPPTAPAALGQSVSRDGGSQPHDNMQPSLVVNFCIATVGVFPSRN